MPRASCTPISDLGSSDLAKYRADWLNGCTRGESLEVENRTPQLGRSREEAFFGKPKWRFFFAMGTQWIVSMTNGRLELEA